MSFRRSADGSRRMREVSRGDRSLLDMVREQMGANYIYIADQTDGRGKVISTLTYLVDADNPDDDMEPFQPGDKSPMNESFLEDSRYIYETGSRSDNYFYSHSDFGYNTSAIVPVENSAGEIVAIIGVELAMKTLEAARTEYVIYVILLGSSADCHCDHGLSRLSVDVPLSGRYSWSRKRRMRLSIMKLKFRKGFCRYRQATR